MDSTNEISMQKLWKIFKKKCVWILAIAVIFGCIGAVFGQFFIQDTYTCVMTCQVKYPANATYNEIQAAKEITKQYVVYLQSNTAVKKVVDAQHWQDSKRWAKEVAGGTSVKAQEDSSSFSIKVTTRFPEVSYSVIEKYQELMPELLKENYNSYAVEIIDSPTEAPLSPDNGRRAFKAGILGFLISAIIAYVVFVVKCLFDVTIRTEKDVTDVTKLPILGAIPNVSVKSSYEYQGKSN